MSKDHDTGGKAADDIRVLQSMGYTQELSRSMKPFSDFAIFFYIICIL